MLWTIVIHQNNVAKSSLGPNKDVALSEVWHLLAPSSSRLHHKADKKVRNRKIQNQNSKSISKESKIVLFKVLFKDNIGKSHGQVIHSKGMIKVSDIEITSSENFNSQG